MKRVRVLHIGKYYPPYPGGMETHVRDLAVRQKVVAQVSVVVANSIARNEISEMDGVHIERIARLTTIASMPICPGLPGAIRRSPADLVHIHMPNPGAALAFLMSGHTGKVVITHHADTLGRKVLRMLSDPFVTRLMQRATRITVSSARYLESSKELAPFRNKCRVIPLGIDVERTACMDGTIVRQIRADISEQFPHRIPVVGRLCAGWKEAGCACNG